MAITTTYVTGSEWSRTYWMSGLWGDGVDGEAVLDWMVAEFNRRTGELGSSVIWQPYTGEVIGTHSSDPSYDEPEGLEIDTVRDEIADEAGEIICDGGDRGRELGFWSDDEPSDTDDSDCPAP